MPRATYLIEPRRLILREEEAPRPGPGEALIELHAVGICGSDTHWYTEGRIGVTTLDAPLTLGHEPMGVVVEVGEGVDRALVGRRVAIEPAIHCGQCRWCLEGDTNLCPEVQFLGTPPTQGAFRERIAHPARLIEPLPNAVGDETGALLEPLAIGLHAADLLKIRAASTVLVLGAGPVGLCAMLAARLASPGRLIVVEPLGYRRERASALGADLTFSPEDPDLLKHVRAATGGYGARYVIEAAGTPESIRLMAELAEPGARLAAIGIDPHDRFGFNHSTARRKGLTVYMIRRSRHTLARAIALTAAGRWRPESLVTHRGGLADVAPLMDKMTGYQDGILKAVIDPRK